MLSTVLVVAIIGIVFFLQPPEIGPFAGNRLPDFSVMNRAAAEISYADLSDKPLLVNFWATWCEPCRAEMPLIENVYTTIGDHLHIVAVTDEPLTLAERFFDDLELTLPLYTDVDRSMHEEYLIRFMPTTFFVGQNGIISSVKIGEMNAEMILEHLKDILPKESYDQVTSAFAL